MCFVMSGLIEKVSGNERRAIVSITTLSGNRYEGNMFIDCSYEGDLMASSGISYIIGREANTHYGDDEWR